MDKRENAAAACIIAIIAITAECKLMHATSARPVTGGTIGTYAEIKDKREKKKNHGFRKILD
jgi:hypothetical protein